MAASTAPAARAKVLELLQARAGLSGVQITWAPPTQEEDIAAEMIYLGEKTERSTALQGFGDKLNEDYSFDVVIDFEQDGDDPQTCEARGYALVDEVEATIRADLSLGGLLNKNAEFGAGSVETVPVQGAWRCTAHTPIVCHAQI